MKQNFANLQMRFHKQRNISDSKFPPTVGITSDEFEPLIHFEFQP